MRRLKKSFSRGRFIAHAGGEYQKHRYSNSVEALSQSRQTVSLIEFDVCASADGWIVAHDGLESHYGLTQSFDTVRTEDFRKTRYAESLQPMSLADLIAALPKDKTCAILDIKASKIDEYKACLEEVCRVAELYGVTKQIIPQVYTIEDIEAVRAFGLDNFILALWKTFGDVRTERCMECVATCFNTPPEAGSFQAMSLAARFVLDQETWVGDDLHETLFTLPPEIFIHGQFDWQEKRLIEKNFGLFTHNPQNLLAFT